jgi:alkaline phosphatase
MVILLGLLAFSCTIFKSQVREPQDSNTRAPKNIIFMIVDGMGFEYVKAARIYNAQMPLNYENFPCKTKVSTCAYEGSDKGEQCLNDSRHITDSAAAATAIASGVKVSNGVISQSIPGSRADIKTILEVAKDMNKSTGIISTTLFTDATPAAFAAHAARRGDTEDILKSIFLSSMPHIVFGADTPLHRNHAKASSGSYLLVNTASELKKIAEKISNDKKCFGIQCPRVYAGFGQHQLIPHAFKKEEGILLEITPQEEFNRLDLPHLSEMTDAALKILDKNAEGFFLMIESALPDTIGHNNEQFDESSETPSAIAILVREMIEVERTISILQDFVKAHPDTLLILTADHETGGLVIEDHKTDCLGELHCLASVRWTAEKYEPGNKNSAARHTGVDVPLYAIGLGSERFCQERINNTDISNLALALPKNSKNIVAR